MQPQAATLRRVSEPSLLDRDVVGRIGLLTSLVIAFIVRWIFLGTESLWFDEGWTWWLVTQPVGDMHRLIAADTCAPLYFYLLHFWTLLFGDTERGMRSMSALFATLALVPWFLLARRTFETKVPLMMAALLVALACMQVQYAREARPYALATLVIICAAACIPTLAARRSWPAMLGFAAGVTAGMYTHNTSGFYAPCLAAAWLIWPGERSPKNRLVDLAIVVGICIAAYAPWLPTLMEQAKWVSGNFWAEKPDFFDVTQVLSVVSGVDIYSVTPFFWRVFGWSPGTEALATAIAGLLLLTVVVSLSTGDRRARRRTLAMTVAALGPIVLLVIQSHLMKPVFISRLFLPTSVLTPLLIALALEQSRAKLIRCVGLAIAGVFLFLNIISSIAILTVPQKDNWRGAYSYVRDLPPSSTRLIVFVAAEGELPFAHYASKAAQSVGDPRTGVPQGFFDLNPPRTMQRILSPADLGHLRKMLSGGTYDEIVLVLAHEDHVDKQHRSRRFIEERWRRVDQLRLPNIHLLRYVPR